MRLFSNGYQEPVPTCVRQVGQVPRALTHGMTHAVWNTWQHGSAQRVCGGPSAARHTAHGSRADAATTSGAAVAPPCARAGGGWVGTVSPKRAPVSASRTSETPLGRWNMSLSCQDKHGDIYDSLDEI